jgi:hypothetical protein
MCVRRKECDDQSLEDELRAYFIRVVKMDADAAHEAARRWIEHLNRNEAPE